MAWTVYGDKFETADFTGTTVSQQFSPKSNIYLRAVRAWFIVYNDPTVTTINAKIYSGSTPGELIATSTDSISKAELCALDYGIKEVYFTFNDVPLEADSDYSLVINGTGYTASAGSFIAWRRAWPDPVTGGFTPTSNNLMVSPFTMYLVGADL